MARTIPLLLLTFALAACSAKRAPGPDSRAAAPPTGSLTVTSEPAGAAVLLRGHRRLGKTPLTIRRPDATGLRLTLIKDGHLKDTFNALVEGGRSKNVHRKLRALQGTLVVHAGPFRGGRVTVDGEYVGRLPLRAEVDADKEHQVEAVMEGFHPYRERVTVQAGKKVQINAVLLPSTGKAPRIGWLTVTSDTPAVVSLSGKALGKTPLGKLPVPARQHKLQVTSARLKLSRTVKISVKAGEVKVVNVDLLPGR